MTDLGSFATQTERLREHATFWDGRAENIRAGRDDITPALSRGYQFGFLAGRFPADVSGRFDTWVHSMSEATLDALRAARYMRNALTSAANAYDGVDSTVATDMAVLDRQIDEG